ncbi:MAG: hypothetical protein RLZZ618_2365 [Pseudomonadota bacterium]|jgi:pimeloyl-ACP methyl ester carboxylesterase
MAHMLARLQQLITLGLLAAAGGSAWWFVQDGRPERAWWGAAVIVLGYASFMALEFVVMRLVHRDDPAPRATLAQLVKSWWGEIVTAPRIFCWQQPFRSRRFADHLPAGSRAHGVVLVHGFVCNRGFWNRWMQELRRRNIPFVAVNLEPILGSIADYGSIIEHAVRQIEVTTGRAPVIVGHSMGGLAARVWMAEHRGAVRAHRVITIGSPHQGTWPARFGWSTNAREMRQTSALQTGLQAQESAQSNARFTCFYGHCDNIVFPASSGTLPGADNRHLHGVAHVHMADHPAVFAEALHWIAAGHGSDATEPMPLAPLSGK